MQAVNPTTVPTAERTQSRAAISLETLAYAVLIVLAVVLRLAELDTVPLTDYEARQAVATLHALDAELPGTADVPSSPVVFWLQTLGFNFLGAGEWTARLGGVIGGVILLLLPLALRARLGALRTFIMCVLLALLPVPFVAAREHSPAIWAAVFTVLLVIAVWRYLELRRPADATLSIVSGAALLFLSGAAGVLFSVILVLTGVSGALWVALNAPQDDNRRGDDVLLDVRQALQSALTPFSIGVALLVVLAVASGFMLHTQGMTYVGEAFEQAAAGLVTPFVDGAPLAYPLLTLLVYDSLLVIFGVAGVIVTLRQEHIAPADRVGIAWLLTATVVLLMYRGGAPAHALILVLPLIWFAAKFGALLMQDYLPEYVILPDDMDIAEGATYFWWLKWVFAAVTLFLLLLLGVHWQEVARNLMQTPGGLSPGDMISRLFDPAMVRFRYSAVWLVIGVLFTFIVSMLAASLWGLRNTLQGLGLGLFLFMIGSGLGGGWYAAVVRSQDPAELWHVTATAYDTHMLRETLYDIAQRDTRGFPLIPVTVVEDKPAGIDSGGVVGWLLRDFEDVRYVSAPQAARRAQIVFMPAQNETPDLGGAYVGQRFELSRTATQSPGVMGLPAYLSMRRLPGATSPAATGVLWLRQDVYDGVPSENRIR